MNCAPLQFRAFDTKKKTWLTNFALRPDGLAICSPLETDGSGIVVVQATGIKDKHGKPEFCGDVLKITALNEFGSIQDVYAEIYFDTATLAFKTTDQVSYKYEIIDEEIVGSVHSSPELMQKTRRPLDEPVPTHGEKTN